MDVTHDILTGLIFLLGISTVWLSGYACLKFHQFHRKLSPSARRLTRAVSWQLFGESIIGFGTLIFATAEFMGWLKGWPYTFTSTLRFIMFAATSLTTYHLVKTIHNLEGS